MSDAGFSRVRRVGLSLPGATEQVQWVDHLLLKVGGKMFVVLATTDAPGMGRHVMSIKCSDDDFDRLDVRLAQDFPLGDSTLQVSLNLQECFTDVPHIHGDNFYDKRSLGYLGVQLAF